MCRATALHCSLEQPSGNRPKENGRNRVSIVDTSGGRYLVNKDEKPGIAYCGRRGPRGERARERGGDRSRYEKNRPAKSRTLPAGTRPSHNRSVVPHTTLIKQGRTLHRRGNMGKK